MPRFFTASAENHSRRRIFARSSLRPKARAQASEGSDPSVGFGAITVRLPPGIEDQCGLIVLKIWCTVGGGLTGHGSSLL